MSLVGQVESAIKVKASADKIHEVFSCRPYIVAKTSPGRVQSCELLEGEWGKVGSVISWRLTADGSTLNAKETVEVIDNKNYLTTFKLIEGRPLDLYKSFYSITKVTQNEKGSLVHFTYRYEKQNKDVPDLDSTLLHMMNSVIKDIDAHLTQQE